MVASNIFSLVNCESWTRVCNNRVEMNDSSSHKLTVRPRHKTSSLLSQRHATHAFGMFLIYQQLQPTLLERGTLRTRDQQPQPNSSNAPPRPAPSPTHKLRLVECWGLNKVATMPRRRRRGQRGYPVETKICWLQLFRPRTGRLRRPRKRGAR